MVAPFFTVRHGQNSIPPKLNTVKQQPPGLMLNSMLRSHKDMNVLLPFGNQMWQWKTHHSFRLSHLNVPVMEGFPATMTPDSHGVLLRTWWWHTQMPGASQIPVASWPPTLENLWIPFTVPSPIGMAYRNGVSEWWSMEFDDKSLLRMVIFFFFVAMLYNYIYMLLTRQTW